MEQYFDDFFDIFYLFFISIKIDYNVIKIDYCKLILIRSKDMVHHMLKYCQTLFNPKTIAINCNFAY